jgi:hypothetical protein
VTGFLLDGVGADHLGRLLLAPATVLIIGFPLVMPSGPGRGYL